MIKEKRKYDLNMIDCSQEAVMFKDQPRDIKLSGMNRVAQTFTTRKEELQIT